MTIGRNDLCACGSGKKYKKCCYHRRADRPLHQYMPAPAAEVLVSEGVKLHQSGKILEACAKYQAAINANETNPDAWHLIGLAFAALDDCPAAVAAIENAIKINPKVGVFYSNLGSVFLKYGQWDRAEKCFRNAIELDDKNPTGYFGLAETSRRLGHFDLAVELLNKVVELSPQNGSALNSLGVVAQQRGKLDDAFRFFTRAIQLKPDDADPYVNIGALFLRCGRLGDAESYLLKAIDLNPKDSGPYNNLGTTYRLKGDLDQALLCFRKALQISPRNPAYNSNVLYVLAYRAALPVDAYLSVASKWEAACLSEAERVRKSFVRQRSGDRRLRIGYVSGDFCQHAVSYFVERIFMEHDKNKVELFAYASSPKHDEVTDRLQALVDHWRPFYSASVNELLDTVENDQIDILVDLSGHTSDNRMDVFSRRAAPVQVHYLGYFGTTGVSQIDYWIADDNLVPDGAEKEFSEKIWRLPRVWVAYAAPVGAPEPRRFNGATSEVWVGSFNNLAKVTPETVHLWARLLLAEPRLKLLLKTKELHSQATRDRLISDFVRLGVSADRIALCDASETKSWNDHMAYYGRLDISLDPVGGVGGGTTTCDALWMGVPVVTIAGDRMASRMTASMLHSIGHAELIAYGYDEYIDKVIGLAKDEERRQALRGDLRRDMESSALYDAKGLAGSLENAYAQMFNQWEQQQER